MDAKSYTYEEFPACELTALHQTEIEIDPHQRSVHALPLQEYARAGERGLHIRFLQPSFVAEEMIEGQRFPIILFIQGQAGVGRMWSPTSAAWERSLSTAFLWR